MTNQKFKIKSNSPKEGEIAQTEDGKYKVFKDGEWHDLKMEGSNLELGLYDLNIALGVPYIYDYYNNTLNVLFESGEILMSIAIEDSYICIFDNVNVVILVI